VMVVVQGLDIYGPSLTYIHTYIISTIKVSEGKVLIDRPNCLSQGNLAQALYFTTILFLHIFTNIITVSLCIPLCEYLRLNVIIKLTESRSCSNEGRPYSKRYDVIFQ
jgi:hypothetical protein